MGPKHLWALDHWPSCISGPEPTHGVVAERRRVVHGGHLDHADAAEEGGPGQLRVRDHCDPAAHGEPQHVAVVDVLVVGLGEERVV